MMHQSVATINSPEFINLQPLEINPLMSSCEIKVLYLGENRNHSFITKDVATEMAKTLRGAPIVGYYKEDKEDFRDHGERVVFDDEGIKFECLTKPYGFVSPDAKVWFQEFEDSDEFGNKTTREYLMTTGYLWTGQFEECASAVESGRPQSMELDEQTLDGHWSTNSKTGMDFFIINDAIFSKLCILGNDIEPCFEGASITAPEVSTSFTKIDDNFKKTLYTMMQDLKFALEGGQNMVIEENIETSVTEEVVAEEIVEAVETESVVEEENTIENDNSEQSNTTENQDSIEETPSTETFACKDDEDKKTKHEKKDDEEEKDNKEEDSKEDEDEEDKEKKYSLLTEEFENLKTAYADLETKYNELVEFKLEVENNQKEELINSFYMLSDEDKADVIANKANYSLEEIESKLSVICVRKKVSFDLEEEKGETEDNTDVTTYSLNNSEETFVPAWISAVRNTRDSKKD